MSLPIPLRRRVPAALLALALLGLGLAGASVYAENFTGRQAPDISLADGVQGLAAGDSLARHRGQVVLLTFWFRDCPICRRHLPQVQALYDRYQGFGLDVVTVVDKYAPAEVVPVLRQFGWTFPTASDRVSSRARAFGVGRRPEEYLVAPDGRVVASMQVRPQDVEAALAGWRVERCGPWPTGSDLVRRHVAGGAYGEALKVQGTEAGLAARVLAEARRDMQARVARIRRGLQRRADVREDVGYLRTAFQGTALESEAQAALQALFPNNPR